MSLASPSRLWLGTVLAVAAAIAFAVSNLSASLAFQGGSNPPTLAATRFVLPTLVLVAWLLSRRVSPWLAYRQGLVAAALGVVTALYTWALLSAIGAIPLALAILIFYLFPLVATVVLAVCGWEKIGWRTFAAIAFSFVGLALALDPRVGNLDLTGVALAFGAALGLGTVIAVSSRVFREGDSRPVTLYMAAVAAVLLIGLCMWQDNFAFPHTTRGWTGFVGAAVSYAFAMIAFYIAVSMIGPMRASLLSYAEPVVAAGLGVTVLGEALTLAQTAGIALVILSLLGATIRRSHAN